jgi:hypothetical protein
MYVNRPLQEANMVNAVCTLPPDGQADYNLRSWLKFLEDYSRQNPRADLRDPILIETLNVKWLRGRRKAFRGNLTCTAAK